MSAITGRIARTTILLLVLFGTIGCSGRVDPEALVGTWVHTARAGVGSDEVVDLSRRMDRIELRADRTYVRTFSSNVPGDPEGFTSRGRWFLRGDNLHLDPEPGEPEGRGLHGDVDLIDTDSMWLDGNFYGRAGRSRQRLDE